MDVRPFDPETTIGFLLSDTARLMRKQMDQLMRDHGATRTQWRVLAWIARMPGIHQAKLAEMLEVEPITLCRVVDRMEEAGLVRRAADGKDRRVRQLYVTEKAAPILNQLRQVGCQFNSEVLADFSAEEIAQLRQLLLRLRDRLGDRSSDGTDRVPA